MTATEDSTTVASTAYHELLHSPQNLTEAGYNELVAVAERVASTNSLRPFVEELQLDDPSVLISELTATGRLGHVVQTSSGALSFTRQLYVALRNTLFDLHRKTDAGALARRIAAMLRRSEHFEQSEQSSEKGKWCSRNTPLSGCWDGDLNVLVNAAWEVDITAISEWRGHRRTPVCTDSDLVHILDAVLTAAQAPVDLSVVVYAVQHRFALLYVPATEIDDEVRPESMSVSVESQALDMIEAGGTIELLSDEERLILEAHGLTDRRLAEVLGCSPTTAGKRRNRLTATLEALGWTGIDGPPSIPSETGRHS